MTSPSFSAPQSETERVVAAIWQDVLQVERVGREDNFVALGGDSLYGIELMMRVEEALGVEVSARDTLSDNLAAFSACIDALLQSAKESSAGPSTGGTGRDEALL